MPPSLTIFLKLFGGFLVFGAIAAAVVAWLPRWAEAMSNHVLDWRIGVGLVAIGFLVWRFVPAAWQPAILIPLLGIAFVAIPMIVGILLFPVETRDGQPVDPIENPPTGPTLVDRLREPWSSATPARDTAAQFAGPGGVLLRVKLLREGSHGRDIRDLSALRTEEEVGPPPATTVR